jgi:hypothetical protein
MLLRFCPAVLLFFHSATPNPTNGPSRTTKNAVRNRIRNDRTMTIAGMSVPSIKSAAFVDHRSRVAECFRLPCYTKPEQPKKVPAKVSQNAPAADDSY